MSRDSLRVTTNPGGPVVRPPPHLPRFVGYQVTDLAPAPGTCDTFEARALNNLDQVVGIMYVGGHPRGFAWSTQIGVKSLPDQGPGAAATCVNDGGVIGGWFWTASPARRRACLWRSNVLVDLGAPSGTSSAVADLNSAGVAVGELDGHAFCSQPGGLVDLGTLGGSTSGAAAINSAGQIVGWSENASGGSRRGFVCDGPGQPLRDLGDLGGDWSVACDINDAGQIVGYSADAQRRVRACLWQNGVLSDLGTLGGLFSNALAINGGGTIAGMSAVSPADRTTHAFVYGWPGPLVAPGVPQMNDVNRCLTQPAGQPTFDAANAINDSGRVLVGASYPVRYLLTPIIVLR